MSTPATKVSSTTNTNSTDKLSLPPSLALMLGPGLAFLVWILVLIYTQELPSGNTATNTSRNKNVMVNIAPILILLAIATVGGGFFMNQSSSVSKYTPLLLIPMVSLLMSVLALYFSFFQINVSIKA